MAHSRSSRITIAEKDCNIGAAEAAKVLGVSPDTIYKMWWDGTLPCTRVRRRRTISLAALLEWKAANANQNEVPTNG